MPDILIQPNADADDDLSNAIVMNDTTLPLSSQGAVALGLTLGTTYKARVLGVVETFSVAVPATAPAQMSAPTVTATGANSISVDLAAAPADGGSAITSYDLRYSPNESDWTVVNDVSDPQTVSGLTASTLYYVQTRAVNAVDANPSNWSTSGTATTDAVASDPASDIVTLLGANGKGVYDTMTWSRMWQDTAGTVPVTAAGQPVRRVDDLSGNANHLYAVTGNAIAQVGYVDWNGAVLRVTANTGYNASMDMFALIDVTYDSDDFWLLAGRAGGSFSGIYAGVAEDGGSAGVTNGFGTTTLVVDNGAVTNTRQGVFDAMSSGGGYKALGLKGANMSGHSDLAPLGYSLPESLSFEGRCRLIVISLALTSGTHTSLQAIFDGAK